VGFSVQMAKKLNETGSVAITIQNDTVREQTRQLLMGLGIRTLRCDGVNRCSGFVGRSEKTKSYKLLSRTALSFGGRLVLSSPISLLRSLWSTGSKGIRLRLS